MQGGGTTAIGGKCSANLNCITGDWCDMRSPDPTKRVCTAPFPLGADCFEGIQGDAACESGKCDQTTLKCIAKTSGTGVAATPVKKTDYFANFTVTSMSNTNKTTLINKLKTKYPGITL